MVLLQQCYISHQFVLSFLCIRDDDDDYYYYYYDIARYSCPCSRHEFICKNGDIAPLILKLGSGWRQVVRFTLLPHYSWRETLVPTE
jgi:hypothetical protein